MKKIYCNHGEISELFSEDDVKDMDTIHVMVHDGVFHADDVVSVALIKICIRMLSAVYPCEIEVTRSRKTEAFLEKNQDHLYLVLDVGGGKYDHHNKDRETYPNGVMYSAVGKILRDIPDSLISKELKEELLINGLYGVQAQDNGQKDLAKDFQNPFTFVHQFNANWTENLYGEEQNAAFDKAVEMAKTVLERLFKNCKAKIDGEHIVKKCASVNSPIIELPDFVSGWQATVIEENKNRKNSDKIRFVVFPQGKQYRVQAVPMENGSFEVLTKLSGDFIGENPEDTPEKVKNLLGNDDVVFCHPGRFIAGARSKETCIAMAKYSLNL